MTIPLPLPLPLATALADALRVMPCTRVASYARENAAPGVKQKVDRT